MSGRASTGFTRSGGVTCGTARAVSTGFACSGWGSVGVAIWRLSAISIGAGTLAAFERMSTRFSASAASAIPWTSVETTQGQRREKRRRMAIYFARTGAVAPSAISETLAKPAWVTTPMISITRP